MELQELQIGQEGSREVILYLVLLLQLVVVEDLDGLEEEMPQDYLEDLVEVLLFREEQEILHQYLHHKVIREVHLEVDGEDLVLQVGQMVVLEVHLPLHLILMEHLDQHLEDILPVVPVVLMVLLVVQGVGGMALPVLRDFQHHQQVPQQDL